nr:hypothetical protein [Kouleothrix sp.]
YLVDAAGDVVVEAAGAGADRIWASVNYTLGAGVAALGTAAPQAARATPAEPNPIMRSIWRRVSFSLVGRFMVVLLVSFDIYSCSAWPSGRREERLQP